METMKTLFPSAYVLIRFLGALLVPVKGQVGCDMTLTAGTGALSSPGYPSVYQTNLDCEWIIEAQAGLIIEITFEEIGLPEADVNSICFDVIQVFDGSSDTTSLISSFCENGPAWPSHPTRFLSTGNRLTVVMITDGIATTNTGFSASYRQVAPKTEYIAAVAVDTSSIIRFDRLRSQLLQPIDLPGSSDPSALTFDPIESYFYYTDVQEKFIARVKEDGTESAILVQDAIDDPVGIFVAYLTSLLYWTDAGRDEVSVSSLDGTLRKVIAPSGTGCESPRGIVLDISQQFVFWTCSVTIEVSRADGADRQTFVSDRNDVRSLAIDPEGETLYWVNVVGDVGRVEQINLDGSNGMVTYQHELFATVHGFAVDDFALFWTHPGDRVLYHVAKGGSTLRHVAPVNSPPMMEGLSPVNSEQVIPEQHQCAINNGGCTELCFPREDDFSCDEVTPLVSGCPLDISISTSTTQTVSWTEPTAMSRSNGQSSVSLSYELRSHIPGSLFPLGITKVTYSFSDDFGNEAFCSFDVILSTNVAESCDVTLSDATGTFSSPGFPSAYQNNLNCEWTFEAPNGMVIEVTFQEINIQEEDANSNCLDYIQVYDGVSNDLDSLVSSFCGDGPGWPEHPVRFLSTTNQLTVVMQTDGTIDVNAAGFSAEYRQVTPRTEYVAAVGTDTSSIIRFNRFSLTLLPSLTIPGSTSPSALTFDPVESYFYYSDVQGKFIGRLKEDGTQSTILVQDGIDNPLGIAVAFLTRLLYWTDATRNDVSVSRLDGTFRNVIAPSDGLCESPRGIVLSRDNQLVFWSCKTSIERSKADGSERQGLVVNLHDVRSLAIDPNGETLYWVNVQNGVGHVDQINIDGTNARGIYEHELFATVHGFAVDEFAFFWTHPGDRVVYHIDKGGTTLRSVGLTNSPPMMEGLYYYNSQQPSQEQHQCASNNGGCPELCFPVGSTPGCAEVTPFVSGCPLDISLSTIGPEQVQWTEPMATSRSNRLVPVILPYSSRSHSPGSFFQLGTTTVIYLFSDEFGNEAQCSFNVILSEQVNINNPPQTPVCPVVQPVTSLNGNIGNLVTWYIGNCVDTEDGSIIPVCDSQSGTLFPVGQTQITCVCTDLEGASSQCDFSVEVLSVNTPPQTPVCPVVQPATSLNGNIGNLVTWYIGNCVDTEDGSIIPVCDLQSGTLFPVGQTQVTCVCTDLEGASSQCDFTVEVLSVNTPPQTPVCPVVQPVTSLNGNIGNLVTWYIGNCVDTEDGSVIPVCDSQSGTLFPVGQTQVTCVCTDSEGASSQCDFPVEVLSVNNPPQTPVCPVVQPVTSLNGNIGNLVTWYIGNCVDTEDGSIIPVCDLRSGTLFPVGQTQVTCVCTDSEGASTQCDFPVEVLSADNSPPPSPVCPVSQSVSSSLENVGQVVTWNIGNCLDREDGSIIPLCDSESGNQFPVGQTQVTCVCKDSDGASSECDFTVEVLPAPTTMEDVSTSISTSTVELVTIMTSSPGFNFNDLFTKYLPYTIAGAILILVVCLLVVSMIIYLCSFRGRKKPTAEMAEMFLFSSKRMTQFKDHVYDNPT